MYITGNQNYVKLKISKLVAEKWLFRLDSNIFEYTKRLTKEDFSANTLVQDAVIRNFEIIGEASKKVSNEFKKVNTEVLWKEMAGMRDKLIHDYIGLACTGTPTCMLPIDFMLTKYPVHR